MNQDELKRQAALAAMDYLPDGGIIGVGTGSTVNHFIDALATIKGRFEGAASSSEASTERMKQHGIPVLDLNSCGTLEVYVDGADESNLHLHLIKGGGGALTREKIIAAASKKFVCIADESKLVDVMGKFPLPVEVIPMARSYVAREIVKLGGNPVLREGFTTDNGNVFAYFDTSAIAAGAACTSPAPTNGGTSNGDNVSGTLQDFQTFGMVVVQKLSAADDINATNNNLSVGFCDGESNLVNVADNITF